MSVHHGDTHVTETGTSQTTVRLPGHPFGVVASPHGEWLFVTLQSAHSAHGVAVLRRDGLSARLAHVIPLPQAPAGLALTRDGSLLLVATRVGVAFVDTARAVSGARDAVLGVVRLGRYPVTVQVTLSRDERHAFATDEHAGRVSVLDVPLARSTGYSSRARVSRIPVDVAPVGMALSPDGRYLYVTSQAARPRVGWAGLGIVAASAIGLVRPVGTLSVVELTRVERDPAHAVVARVRAGRTPVRVALSPDGAIAWVTARGGNALLAFDTAQLLADPSRALPASTPTGPMPVGITLVAGGSVAVVANSNRRAGGASPQTISLIDTAAALAGRPATLATVRVGAFPRECARGPDGHTLFVTNFNSDTLTVIDLAQSGLL